MDFLSNAFLKGGYFMYGVLAALVLSLALTLILTGLGLTKRRIPLLVWFIPPILPYLLGAIGTAVGLHQAAQAVEHATESTQYVLASAGAGTALYTMLGGLFAMLIVLMFQGLGASMVCFVTKGPDTSTHWGRPIGLILLSGFVGLALTGWAIFASAATVSHVIAGLVLIPTGFGMAISAWKLVGWEATEAANRDAEARLVVAMTLLLVLLIALTLSHLSAQIQIFEAVAFASAETGNTLLANAAATQDFTWIFGAVTIGAAGILSSALLSPVASKLGEGRNGFAFLSFAAVVLFVFMTESNLNSWAKRFVETYSVQNTE